MEIRAARPDEAAALSSLALRSKGHWGYSPELLEKCRAELTIAPERVVALRAHVAVDGGARLGFFTVAGTPPDGELDCLYVEPTAMGRGVGRALLEAALRIARMEGFCTLVIHADPHAEAFYLRHGATRLGEVPSGSIAGRLLPCLRMTIHPAHEPIRP